MSQTISGAFEWNVVVTKIEPFSMQCLTDEKEQLENTTMVP